MITVGRIRAPLEEKDTVLLLPRLMKWPRSCSNLFTSDIFAVAF
jgi:hypothetical protein